MSEAIFITGAAGLVGQNLIAHLVRAGVTSIVAVDKHTANLAVLARLHPQITFIDADLAEPGPWQETLADCSRAVFLHAQIGGLDEAAFERNNITATRNCLDAISGSQCRYLVHVSSSVVNSAADDLYKRSKAAQEELVAKSAVRQVILRPTLMFGWFDRKHLGWLQRFMKRVPVFPVPGHGRYRRQPLYAGDFSAIIAACLTSEITGTHNISGLEEVDYIDLITIMRDVSGLKTPILKLPYSVFAGLLRAYALLDRNPPFTVHQLEALVIPEVFEVIDWPGIFGVRATPLAEALRETFTHPDYADIELAF